MINATLSVGELVAERPDRSRVFEELGIDYCCGGKLPLAEACSRRGLDVDAVRGRLAAHDAGGVPDGTDWRQVPLAELCGHVVATHHAFLRRELPRLRGLVAKLARVHGDRHPELRDTLAVFEPFADELTAHMAKEERVLFPLLARIDSGEVAPDPFVLQPIGVMEAEHDDAGRALAEMRRLTGGYAVPADGCNTYRAAMAGLAELEADMHTHVHKENNILFPRAARLVALSAAGKGLDTRREGARMVK
jgi:regulator of cell morphogenesis and NO signaling